MLVLLAGSLCYQAKYGLTSYPLHPTLTGSGQPGPSDALNEEAAHQLLQSFPGPPRGPRSRPGQRPLHHRWRPPAHHCPRCFPAASSRPAHAVAIATSDAY